MIIIAAIFMAGGCAGSGKSGGTGKHSQKAVMDSVPVEIKIPPYKITPGDTVEIHYYKSYQKKDFTYRLDVADKIFIKVHNHPDYSRESVVLPDGTISVARLGVVKVRGLTVSELDDILTRMHGEELLNPEVDVFVVEPQKKLNDFLDLLFQNSGGKSRSFFIRGDGSIDLPLLEELQIAGLTVTEAQRHIAEMYHEEFANLAISINVTNSVQERIAILGEVNRPGVYPLIGRVNPLHALALAGGGLDTANLSKVVILRADRNSHLRKIFTDVEENSVMTYVQAGDILYVPKSGIANVALFVDQYVRKLLPFNLGAGVYYDLQSK